MPADDLKLLMPGGGVYEREDGRQRNQEPDRGKREIREYHNSLDGAL